MSAVKSFALGLFVVGISTTPILAGSISANPTPQPSNGGVADSTSASWMDDGFDRFPVSSRNSSGELGAQNLAAIWSRSVANISTNGPSFTQPPAGGLFLGVTGGDRSGGYSPAQRGSGNVAGVAPSGYSSPSSLFSSTNAPSPTPAPSSAPVQPTADAFINFGSGPFPEASSLTTGNGQAFYKSPAFTQFFGPNGPTSTDINHFQNEVVATVQSTYNNAGLPISLTTDPSSHAAHTLSIVSGTSNGQSPGAIGITDIGNNGFSFIDKLGSTTSPDALAVAIGHNVSHELMHAFGIANHPEQSGAFVDAASSTLQNLSDPSTGFSPDAARLLSTLNFQETGQMVASGAQRIDGDQMLIEAAPVPEPTTMALWTLAAGLALAYRRSRS